MTVPGFVRGAVRNPREYHREIDYSGLQFGSVTPTDIDGFIEWRNQTHVMLEFKRLNGQPISQEYFASGQWKAMTRIAVDLAKVKPVLVVLAGHRAKDDEAINAAACEVVRYYAPADNPTVQTFPGTVRELLDMWLERYGWQPPETTSP